MECVAVAALAIHHLALGALQDADVSTQQLMCDIRESGKQTAISCARRRNGDHKVATLQAQCRYILVRFTRKSM